MLHHCRAYSFFLLVLVLGLTGCSGKDKNEIDLTNDPGVELLYNKAADYLEAGELANAVDLFQEVERQYPFSEWATRAELMGAYSYYKGQAYDDAILSLDRFIEIHPGNKDTDYAMYLKALSYYEQISDVARDQAMTKDALDALNVLIRRFPDSRYARDARFKQDLVLDHLAGKEMEIGRYYLTRGHVNAAINRFRTVIKSFETTSHTPEALHRLVEAYTTIGLTEEAVQVAAVLGYNYPGDRWYQKSYDLLDDDQRQRIISERDWMDRTVDSLFKPN